MLSIKPSSFFFVCSSCYALQTTTTKTRLVTFDLDDTLFPCGPTVLEANRKLCFALNISELDSARMQARIKQVKEHCAPTKLTYSELRRRAITSFLNDVGRSDEDPAYYFNLWLKARHTAAEKMLFPGTAKAIKEIKEETGATLGAITNGRGNPKAMPSLTNFFDFCVSGEDQDVFPYQKPHPYIFQKALERAGAEKASSLDWIHVGDCLINDIQAAKDVGAKTIWFDDPQHYGDSAFTTKSQAEQSERAQRKAAIKGLYVDLAISSISDLPTAVTNLFSSYTVLS